MPGACKNRPVAELAERVEELRANRTNGGSWLARRAVEALLAVVEEPAASTEELLERLLEAGGGLATARPSQGAIAAAVGRLVASAHAASHLAPDELQRLLAEEANALIAGRDRAAASIAVHLAPQLEDATVLTHSASATASLLLVGADTVYEDGSVKNKIGPRPLAEGAASAGVRVVVACELLKLAPSAPPADEDEPELRDLTPPELVDGIATEEGVCSPEEVLPLIDRTPFLREGYRLLFG